MFFQNSFNELHISCMYVNWKEIFWNFCFKKISEFTEYFFPYRIKTIWNV